MSLFQRTPAPVLCPRPSLAWAGGAVFNPGAYRAPDGTTHLLVRAIAAGYEKHALADHDAYEGAHAFSDYVSAIGHATSQDGIAFDLHPEPVLRPDRDEDRFGVEDPRVTTLGGTAYVTYTALSRPAFGDEDGVGIGLASTTDFRHFDKHGLIGPPGVRDKDAVLFPRLVRGRVAMLHRIVPDVQIAYFADEAELRAPSARYWERYLHRLDAHVVLRPEYRWEGKKIGAGPPPLETPEGWLLLYHGADRHHVYRAGLALLDLDDPRRVIARCGDAVLAPEMPWERAGDVPNVVFPQGLTLDDEGRLHLYYGAADSVIGHATAPLADVLGALGEARRTTWQMPPVSMQSRRRGGAFPDALPTASALAAERLHGGRPVLAPDAAHPWESGVVLNPAAVLVSDADALDRVLDAWPLTDAQRTALSGGAVVMLYRAQGTAFDRDGHKASSLGLALFTPALELVYRHPDPVLAPERPEHDLGVEDPRCTRVGDTFFLYYTGYQRINAPHAAEGGLEGRVQICLATTRDFQTWTLHGPVEGDLGAVPNKNAVLLPEPVALPPGGDGAAPGGPSWVLLHRPLGGDTPMAMHWATAPAPEGPWSTRGPLLVSRRYGDQALSWLGAAGPPEPLGEGRFAALYHQGHLSFDRRRLYNLSAMLLDFSCAVPVRAQIEPVLMPTGALETDGDPLLGVDNVVFSCANYRIGPDWIIPYAGADSRIFGARLDFACTVSALDAAAREATSRGSVPA